MAIFEKIVKVEFNAWQFVMTPEDKVKEDWLAESDKQDEFEAEVPSFSLRKMQLCRSDDAQNKKKYPTQFYIALSQNSHTSMYGDTIGGEYYTINEGEWLVQDLKNKGDYLVMDDQELKELIAE